MKKYLIIIMITFTLCGCELVVDVDIPLEKNKLVLNSFFTPDSLWKAKVTLSRHILDEAAHRHLNDALVVVFEDENPIDTLQHDSLGYYRSDTGKPQPGKTYSIRATTSDFGTVSSSSTCPQHIAATFSSAQQTMGEFGRPEYSLDITFKDQPGKNFYQVMGIGEHRFSNPQTGQGFLNRSYLRVWSDDEGIDENEIENIEGFFFSDVLFNGENFNINLKVMPNIWGTNADTKLYIYFREVSEDYYKYKVTSQLQNYTSGDPFAQPVKVYNNIEDGFGIFAGFTQAVLLIEP